MLQDLLGAQLDLPVRVAIATIVIAALLGLTVLIVRRLSGASAGGGPRSRQARLAVVDSVAVDPRRRLVLVRRDEVEHLLLVGGTSDIVVEPAIGRTAAREAGPGARSLAQREAPALRDAAPAREMPALREPLARETLPPRPSATALSAPPVEPPVEPAAAFSPVEAPDFSIPAAPADAEPPSESERPAVTPARPQPSSADARRPLPQRRPPRSEDLLPPRPPRPSPATGDRFARPAGSTGLSRPLATAQGLAARAAMSSSETETEKKAEEPALTAVPSTASSEPDVKAADAVPATDAAPVSAAPVQEEKEETKPAASAIPVFEIPEIEIPAPAVEPSTFEKEAKDEAAPTSDKTENEIIPAEILPSLAPAPQETVASEDAEARIARALADAPEPEQAGSPIVVSEEPAPALVAPEPVAPEPADADISVPAPQTVASEPAPEPVAAPPVSVEPTPVLMPAAPLLPEMPLTPVVEPDAPVAPAAEEPAPRTEPLAAPAFRRVPMFSINRPAPAPAAERTEPQIGDLAKRLETSLGEALGTSDEAKAPPVIPVAPPAPPADRSAPRIGPARFSPIMRAGITPTAKPPAPPPHAPVREVRPDPVRPTGAAPVLTGADLGLEADLVRQLELTLAREAEAEEAARAEAKAAEEKAREAKAAADAAAQTPPAEKSSDPFDDLEAEMATLLGRTPAAR